MYLIFSLLIKAVVAFLIFDLLTVLLSYSISWYEKSNADPSLIEQRFSWKNLRLLAWLVFPEVFFNSLTVASIPFGMIRRKTPHLIRGVPPTLLLHGLFDNQASWFWFKWQLKRRGIKNLVTINLSSWHKEEVLTELLAKRIDEIRIQVGVNKVHLVGHSMGGMIARNYIQLRGGADKVDQLVCLGTPHHGSKLASFSIAPLGKILLPSSDFLKRLNNAAVPQGVTLTNIYSRKDNMVLPNEFNHLIWGNAVELDNMGHTALIYRSAAIDAVAAALKNKGNA